MSQLLALRDATATSLAADARLAGVYVSTHGGNFTDEELRRYGAKAPHIVVAMLAAPVTLQGGLPVAEASLVAVVIESDRPGAGGKRADRAIALVDGALRVLSRLWAAGMDGISKPRDIRASNAYGPAWDKAGLAAWTISWTQTVELSDSTVWDSFTTLDTKYDISPPDNSAPIGQVPDAEDTQTLT